MPRSHHLPSSHKHLMPRRPLDVLIAVFAGVIGPGIMTPGMIHYRAGATGAYADSPTVG